MAEKLVAESANQPPKSVKIGLDALGYARPEPVVGDWIAVHRELTAAMEGILGPQAKPVKASLDAIAPRINEAISPRAEGLVSGGEDAPTDPIQASRGLLWSEYRDAYLFLLPWLLGFVIWQAGPMVASLYFSMTRYEMVTPPEWVGPAQYVKLFQDDRFYLALYNSAFYVFFGVPTHLLSWPCWPRCC